jgi:hypothetical protein
MVKIVCRFARMLSPLSGAVNALVAGIAFIFSVRKLGELTRAVNFIKDGLG